MISIINKSIMKNNLSKVFSFSVFLFVEKTISSHLRLLSLVTMVFWGGLSFSQTANDNATNYGGSWTNASNGGSGFGAWNLSAGANTGVFIGNPANDGMGTTGIGTTAFGMYAVASSGYFNAGRSLNTAMAVGDILSFYWAVNWDTGGGNKGFDFKSGATTIFNVNMAGNANIVAGGVTAQSTYGTAAMLVTMMRTSTTTYQFTMTSRSGGATYSVSVNNASAIDNINFYIGAQADNAGQRNMYFNQLRHYRSAFRSAATGIWATVATWQMSLDGGATWVASSVAPNDLLGPVTVLNAHTVTVNANLSIDETTINTGGTLTHSTGTLTVENGNGMDLTNNGTLNANATLNVNGTLRSSSTFNKGVSGVITFNSGGVYEHFYSTTAGTIPTATWTTGSTCLVSGYTTNTAALNGLSQNFSNFTWNCPSQTSAMNLNGLTIILGNLSIHSTGVGSISLASSFMSVVGDFLITGGNILNTNSVSIWLEGNFNMSAGTISMSTGTNLSPKYFEFNFSSLTATQSISKTGGTFQGSTNNYFNWVIGTTAPGQVQLLTNLDVGSFCGGFSVNLTGILDLKTYQISGTIVSGNAAPGAFIVSSAGGNSGTLITAHASGINGGTSNAGSIITSGTRTFNSPNLVYNGAVAQTSGDIISTVRSLTVNNSAGLTLTNNCVMNSNGVLTLTNGKVSIQNNSGFLEMNNSAASAVVGGSSSAFIETDITNGKSFNRAVLTGNNYLFPVGANNVYSPVNYNFSANSAVMKIRMFVDGSTPSPVTGMSAYIANRHWYVELLSGQSNTYTYTAQYGFAAGDLVGSLSAIRMGRLVSGAWVLDNTSAATGTTIQIGTLTNTSGAVTGRWAGVSTPGAATPPTITSFTPTSGGQGSTISITGTNFTGATAVSFGGTAATSFAVNSATSITATVASGASGSVSVTTPSGTATLAGFTYIPAPTITSFTPTSAGNATTVTITGTNLTGATAVSFGGVAATSYTVVSATTINAVVATGASGSVSVTTPGGTATLAGFTFAPLPTMTSFSPTATSVGGWVTITGTNFTGATAVSFGGTSATSFSVVSATSITAFVGAGANGNVSVTTPGGTASLAGFSVIPTLVSWEPNGSTGYGISPLAGTLGTNVALGTMTRSNVSLAGAGTAENNAWGGAGWSTSLAAPIVTGSTPVILFTVRVSPGYGMNLSQIAPFNYQRSANGPTAGLFQYSTDGVNYATISTLSFSFSGTPGAPIAPIDLSGITALQNVNNCTTVTFRIVPYGATAAGGTFYITNLNTSSPDLGIAGTVVALSAPTVSITSG